MPLHWDVTNVKDSDELFIGKGVDRRLCAKSERIVFTMDGVDVGKLTSAAAVKRFYQRYRERCLVTAQKPTLTLADVERHRGLRTNVHTQTDAYWRRRIAGTLADAVKEQLRWEEDQRGKSAVGSLNIRSTV